VAWSRLSLDRSRSELAEYGVTTELGVNGIAATTSSLNDVSLLKIAPLLASLGHSLQTLNLIGTLVSNLEPLRGLTAPQAIDLTGTQVSTWSRSRDSPR
jgi:hypothetical protein